MVSAPLPSLRAAATLAALLCIACAKSEPRTPEAPLPPPAPTRDPSSASAQSHQQEHGHGHEHGHGEKPEHGHGHGQDDSVPTATHRFDDVSHWTRVFDDPTRDAWQKPAEVISVLALGPKDTVADVGTGTGYFVPHLSRAVPQGLVYAIDVEEKLLAHVRERAKKGGFTNVQTVLAKLDDASLPDGVDVVLLVNTYHHIGKRRVYFRSVGDRIGQSGRVVIVDYKLGKFPIGPADSHKLAPEIVQKEMTDAGYGQCRRFDGLPYQYVLVFSRACRQVK